MYVVFISATVYCIVSHFSYLVLKFLNKPPTIRATNSGTLSSLCILFIWKLDVIFLYGTWLVTYTGCWLVTYPCTGLVEDPSLADLMIGQFWSPFRLHLVGVFSSGIWFTLFCYIISFLWSMKLKSIRILNEKHNILLVLSFNINVISINCL